MCVVRIEWQTRLSQFTYIDRRYDSNFLPFLSNSFTRFSHFVYYRVDTLRSVQKFISMFFTNILTQKEIFTFGMFWKFLSFFKEISIFISAFFSKNFVVYFFKYLRIMRWEHWKLICLKWNIYSRAGPGGNVWLIHVFFLLFFIKKRICEYIHLI